MQATRKINLCQQKKKTPSYILSAKKHPFIYCPAATHQNATNLVLQTHEKNQGTVFMALHGRPFQLLK